MSRTCKLTGKVMKAIMVRAPYSWNICIPLLVHALCMKAHRSQAWLGPFAMRTHQPQSNHASLYQKY